MKHNFEERKQNRIANAQRMITKSEQQSNDYYVRAHEISSFIPMGQPILVGHHSEKRHRADLGRIDNNMRKSVEANKKADYYKQKLAGIQTNDAISSDDPQALLKLSAKLTALQDKQQFMKETNKCIRRQDKAAFLLLQGATESLWDKLNFEKWKGFEPYQLSYVSRDIRSVEKRIAALKKMQTLTERDETIKGVRLFYSKDTGRVQLHFKGKPADEVRKRLKQYGFKWAPSVAAWVRMLNNAGIYAAREFLNEYKGE